MRESVTSLRLRAILDSNIKIIALAFILLIASGGSGIWIGYIASSTSFEQVDEPAGELSGSFEHHATVVNESTIYDKGERLENKPLYFTRLSPNATVKFELVYTGDEPLDVEITVTKKLQATADGTPIISETQELHNETIVFDGQSQTDPQKNVSVEVEPNAILMRFEEIRESVETDIGQEQALIRVAVAVEGSDSLSEELDLLINAQEHRYAFEDGDSFRHEFTETRRKEVEEDEDGLYRAGGPVALILGILGVTALGIAHYRGVIPVSEAEREYLEFRDDLAEFEEYIVRIDRGDEQPIEGEQLERLADLVRIAQAQGMIVLEEKSSERFYLEDDGHCYVYVPPPSE